MNILENINKYESGLYCWLNPTAQSRLKIFDLVSELGNQSEISKYHCTVVYSKFNGEALPVPDSPTPIPVRAIAIEQWTDHKDRPLLVMTLQSSIILMINALLQSYGYKHSYPSYTPHITLGYVNAPHLQRVLSDTIIMMEPTLQYSPLQ